MGPAPLLVLLLGLRAIRPPEPAAALVSAARAQVGVTLRYDPRYQRLPYPGGDVPLDRGVCTDVVIRAYRALGLDLQVAVHEDMVRAPEAYPKLWGQRGTDRSIDHRRVPNLAAYLGRHGQRLTPSQAPQDYHPGDVVTWRLPSGLPHIGLVSDRTTPQGRPLVIHNIGWGTQEVDVLFAYPLTGHYRLVPAPGP